MSVPMLTRETAQSVVQQFFAAVDSLSVPGTMYFYTGETTMQFGNAPRVKGIAKIEKLLADFYSLFDSIRHNYQSISIDFEQSKVYYGSNVEYVIKGDTNKSSITIPAMSVMKLVPVAGEEQLKIVDFYVYFDPSVVMEKVKAVTAKL